MLSAVCGLVYFVVKFLEMRFVMKESKPLKFLIRDSILVMVSVYVSYFIINQINPEELLSSNANNVIPAFTGKPEF